jgi:hypothetical protein
MFYVILRTCINLAQFPSFLCQQTQTISSVPINSYIAKIRSSELPKYIHDFPLHETVYQHPNFDFRMYSAFQVGGTDEMIRKCKI